MGFTNHKGFDLFLIETCIVVLRVNLLSGSEEKGGFASIAGF